MPRPFVLDRTLRFYQTENEIFKRCIRVFPDQSWEYTNTAYFNNTTTNHPVGGTIRGGGATTMMGTTTGIFGAPTPGRRATSTKYIHCPDKNVVVEYVFKLIEIMVFCDFDVKMRRSRAGFYP